MTPTLADGDRLLVRWRPAAHPAPGRLAVLRLPGDRGLAVKRLSHQLPEGWWVERDNPAAGTDSWLVGAIPEPDVLAIVVVRLWPIVRSARRSADRG